ncbi:MAG: DUF2336 domain-containing protein [Proteobacteria bacterium]|nr:DUF2336 domain-containing protein [Pseudomonadota bacterium]
MTDVHEEERTALRSLLELAQSTTTANRRVIFENVADLFLSAQGRLTDQQRALMGDILSKLVIEMEMKLRKDLAQRLANLDTAPRELIVTLANDQIEVARPVLLRSPILRDPDLIEIVKHRSQEHMLSVALRAPLSAEVAEAIVDRGDEQVIEQLLKNPDASLSRRALEYLVAESQRVDRFQQPILNRHDLPPELAHRMFWWVSAALRRGILERYSIDSALLDDAIQETTRDALSEPGARTAGTQAARLVEGVADAAQLDERFLVQTLRGGKITAFVAALGRLCRVEPLVARRIVFDPGGQSLAIACRAINVERANFATILLLARQGSANGVTPPSFVNEMMKFYDSITPQRARVVLGYWRADSEYVKAISEIGDPAAKSASVP